MGPHLLFSIRESVCSAFCSAPSQPQQSRFFMDRAVHARQYSSTAHSMISRWPRIARTCHDLTRPEGQHARMRRLHGSRNPGTSLRRRAGCPFRCSSRQCFQRPENCIFPSFCKLPPVLPIRPRAHLSAAEHLSCQNCIGADMEPACVFSDAGLQTVEASPPPTILYPASGPQVREGFSARHSVQKEHRSALPFGCHSISHAVLAWPGIFPAKVRA